MGVVDILLKKMNLNDENEEGYIDDGDEEFLDEEPVRERVVKKPQVKETVNEEAKVTPTKISSIKTTRRNMTNANGMELCVIRPTTIEDGHEITDTLLDNRAVVLNLEGLDVEIAQRIIDFTSGSCYAIHGNLQKISHFIFIITPKTVEISGDFQQDMLNSAFDVPIKQNNEL